MARFGSRAALMVVLALAAADSAFGQTATAGQLVISEFRYRGPNGANDEFIEITNVSGADHVVTALAGSGYGVAAQDGITRCSIPNGTLLPDGGHYLCINSVGYSLASYPAGNGTTATGDATYTTNLPDNTGIALFNNNSGGAFYSLANRLDAVGTTATANTTFKEGTGLPTLVGFPIDYAWVRDRCGKSGSITTFGPCPTAGALKDTNNNAADFYFVDTNGTSAGGGQRLGAPGPENRSSPIFDDATLDQEQLDTCVAGNDPPNTVRDFTSVPAQNSTFGTLDFRHTFTNNTGVPITRLRFRVIDITTFPAPSGIADLRPRTSTAINETVDRPPCGGTTSLVVVQGTTLEQPPTQFNGGAFNSSLSVGTITPATPLAPGASVDVHFLVGLQQTGSYKFTVIPEALPEGGFAPITFQGCSQGPCVGSLDAPFVTAITRDGPTPTAAGNVAFTVTFSEVVNNVDATDFIVTTTGTIAGAAVTNVTGTGSTRTVTVNTGTGEGTVRLDVVDDNSIVDVDLLALGGVNPGDGNFNTGQSYTIVGAGLVPPNVVSITRADPDPTSAATVNFTVTFTESVTGVDVTDFSVPVTGTIAGAAITGISGSGATRTVTVSTGSGDGTIGLNLNDNDSIVDADANPLGGPGDNADFVGEVYTVAKPPFVVSSVPNGPNPTVTPSATFTVTFSENVTGVDITDFALTTDIPAASIVSVAGGGSVYTVTVNTGAPAATGTIRLDVLDDNTIVDADGNPLAGPFTGGVVLNVFAASAAPALDARMLALLAALLAVTAVMLLRKG